MDGFDDLLAPSRSGFEDNPFADPFGKRSGSPDPWASPFATAVATSTTHEDEHTTPTNDPFDSTNAFFQASSSSTENEVEVDAKIHEEPQTLAIATSDPLDSANVTKDDEPEDDGESRLKSPGFRESILTSKPEISSPVSPTTSMGGLPQGFSEIATIRPTALEEHDATIPVRDPVGRATPPIGAVRSTPPLGSTLTGPSSSTTPPPSHAQTQPQGTTGGHTTQPSISSTQAIMSPISGSSDLSISGLDRSLGGLDLSGNGDLSSGFGGGADVLGGGWGANYDTGAGGGWGGEPAPTTTTIRSSGFHVQQPTSTTETPDDDSDDDKPIGQIRKQSQDEARAKAAAEGLTPKKDAGLQPVFVITVDDPQKVGDPIRPYIMYTVHTRTTSPMFQKSAFSVLRRYSDFLWIYETLSMNNPGVVVPPVPEKNPFGRFDDTFVKQRRLALQKCIQKIANHPVLGKDADLKLFLESDTFALDIKHRKAEIAHERGGFMASLGQSLAGPRFYETDEWFEKQKAYLDSLESQLRGLVKAIDSVAKQRSEIAIATAEFAQTVQELSESDVGKQLAHSLAGLADVEKKAQDLQNIQAEQDIVTLLATVDEYARLINSVRMAFSSRIRTYHSWKQSESDLLRIKQNHERNRAQGKIQTDKLSYSLSQIAEAERRALESKHEFEHVSKLIKTEVARFEQERVEDFKDSLHAFLEGMISRQKELITGWENYQHMLLSKVNGNTNGNSNGPPPGQTQVGA